MRLRPKLALIFSIGFGVILALALLAFPRLVSRVSETQLNAMARMLGGYLADDLGRLAFTGDEPAFERSIDARFEFIGRLGSDTGNFRVNKVVLIGEDLRVEVGHPDAEIGADYSSHADIKAAFGATAMAIALEPDPETGALDADIVVPVTLADGDRRVLEVKLDFSGTLALLEAQYARIREITFGFIAAALAAFVIALLLGVRRAFIAPLLAISEAMARVGQGDLEARVGLRRSDELGEMAAHFDGMVRGLKERFELERYVSKSTVGAARARAETGGPVARPVERKVLTVLFTDVRGFTSYSEKTDPARVVAVLNRLLGEQEAIVAACSGYVDKFVADETMAVFERPVDAVAAAVAIRERLTRMSGEIDGLAVGLGIHVGEMVEGDIGSPRMMNHTVIGDTVNAAARLQAAAKAGQVIVSAELAADQGVAATFELRHLGGIAVKGKELPIDCWEVGGRKGG